MTSTQELPIVTREDGSRWRKRVCNFCNQLGWYRYQRGFPGRCEACRLEHDSYKPKRRSKVSNYIANPEKRASRTFIYDFTDEVFGTDVSTPGYLYLADVEKESDELRQATAEGVLHSRRHAIGFDSKAWPENPQLERGEVVLNQNIRLGIAGAAGTLIGNHDVDGLLLNFDSYGTLLSGVSPGPDFVSCLQTLRRFRLPIVAALTFTRSSRRGYDCPAYCVKGESTIMYEAGRKWSFGTIELPEGFSVLHNDPHVYSSTGMTDMQVIVVGYKPERG